MNSSLKKLLTIVFCLYSFNTLAKVDQLTFNTDYFSCDSQNYTLYELESQSGLYPSTNIDLALEGQNSDEKFKNLVTALKKISPARARLLEEIHNENPNVIFKKAINISRSSPPSNLLLPRGCSIQILAATTVAYKDYKIIIDQDAYENLSDDGKAYFWLNLALDLEQVSFSIGKANYDYDKTKIDLVLSRHFLACWFSSNCKPKTTQDLNKLASLKDYSLPILEQDGLVIINDSSVVFNANGFIKYARKISEPFRGLPSAAFDSKVVIRNQAYSLSNPLYSHYDFRFNETGKLTCAPLTEAYFPFQNQKTLWFTSENGSFPLRFPLCWDEQQNIVQGEIKLSPGQSLKVNVSNRVLELNQYNRLSDGSHYVVGMSFYDAATIKWILKAKGSVQFNKQIIDIDGPIKLHANGEIACLRFAKKVNLELRDGSRLQINDSELRNDLFCFSEEGKFQNKYTYYEYIRSISQEFNFLK